MGFLCDRHPIRCHSEALPSLKMGGEAWKSQLHSTQKKLVPKIMVQMDSPLPTCKGGLIWNVILGALLGRL